MMGDEFDRMRETEEDLGVFYCRTEGEVYTETGI